MIRSIRTGLLLSATALGLVAAPAMLNATPWSDLSALAGDKGNGNGGGESSGDNGNSGGNGNSDGSSNAKGGSKKVADTEVTTTVKANGKTEKVKNLNAQLAGLNSLNRNVNGLMNSSDPRMELIRAYVSAGAALQAATANLVKAQADLVGATNAYNAYIGTFGLTTYENGLPYADLSLSALQAREAALVAAVAADGTNAAAAAELAALDTALAQITTSPELTAVTTAEGAVAQYQAEVTENQALTTEDALRAALLAAANKNRVAEAGGDAYLTPEIMAWAGERLDGLIADFAAQQP